jgi:hypothetical protein
MKLGDNQNREAVTGITSAVTASRFKVGLLFISAGFTRSYVLSPLRG